MNKAMWSTSYLGLVIFFSGIYYGLWSQSPDNFIVNSELNMTPLDEARSVLWGDGVYATAKHTALSELEEKLGILFKEISRLEGRTDEIEYQITDMDMTHKEALKALNREREREREIEKYKESEFLEYEHREKSYTQAIAIKETELQAIEDPIQRYPLIVELAELRVEKADFNVKFAQKRYEVSNYIVSNYGYFGSDEAHGLVRDLQEKDIAYSEEKFKYQKEVRDIKRKISEQLKLNNEQRKSRLGFIDFLYFSIGISTTTTFGDIIANSRLARAFVGAQLVLCVIVLSGFISRVTGQHD